MMSLQHEWFLSRVII